MKKEFKIGLALGLLCAVSLTCLMGIGGRWEYFYFKVKKQIEIGDNANPIILEGETADDHETTISVTDPTADRTITLPNETGTVVLSGTEGEANAVWFGDGTIVAEGATANAGECTVSFPDATTDIDYNIPDYSVTGTYAFMVSTLSTNAFHAANSVFGGTNQLIFEGSTANDYETILTPTDATADRTITIPNKTGTMQVSTATGTAATFTYDGNTLTFTDGLLTACNGDECS